MAVDHLTMTIAALGGAASGGMFDKWLNPGGYKRRKEAEKLENQQLRMLTEALARMERWNRDPNNALVNQMGGGGPRSRR